MKIYYVLFILLLLIGCSVDETRWSEPRTIAILADEGSVIATYYPNDDAVSSLIVSDASLINDRDRSNKRIIVINENYFNEAEYFLKGRGFSNIEYRR